GGAQRRGNPEPYYQKMMKYTRYVLVPALLLAASCAPASAPSAAAQSALAAGVETITPEDMYARIGFLASDALQGRDTWSPGLEAAAAYLESEHRKFGLEPLGDDGTYYQRYPFRPRRGNLAEAPETVVEESYPPNVVAVLRGSDPQ